MHAMVDIETLGTSPGCSILSIGATIFDHHTIYDTFYLEICRKSCSTFNLIEEPTTLEWWTQQPIPMPIGTIPIDLGLNSFLLWLSNAPSKTQQPLQGLWANSPAFDIAILRHTAEQYRQWPIPYYLERDVRTIKHLLFPNFKLNNTHNALEDAINQTKLVQIALNLLRQNHETRPVQPNHQYHQPQNN